jgi:hypothetical protein
MKGTRVTATVPKFWPIAIVASLLIASPMQAVRADIDPAGDQGKVIQARGGDDALFIWDATPVVAKMVGAKVDDSATLAELEAHALGIAIAKAPALQSANVSVNVLYAATSEVSPAYNAVTLGDYVRVFTLKVKRGDALAKAAAWAKDVTANVVPAEVDVHVSGKLPPH